MQRMGLLRDETSECVLSVELCRHSEGSESIMVLGGSESGVVGERKGVVKLRNATCRENREEGNGKAGGASVSTAQ